MLYMYEHIQIHITITFEKMNERQTAHTIFLLDEVGSCCSHDSFILFIFSDMLSTIVLHLKKCVQPQIESNVLEIHLS